MASRRAPLLLVALACCALALRDVLPSFRSDPFLWHDAAGHIAAAEFARDQLLPALWGWNPQSLCGFPQGELYSPLFHAIAGALGYLIPVPTAVALLVGVSILAVPPTMYALARSHGASAGASAAAAVASPAILWLVPDLGLGGRDPGGTVHSAYAVGMVAHAFALPWLLGFGAALPAALMGRRRWIAIATGSVALLSHLPTALAAACLGICMGLGAIVRARPSRRSAMIRNALAVAFGIAASTAFWWIPFLADRGLGEIEPTGGELGVLATLPTVGALACLAVMGTARARARLAGIAVFVVALSAVAHIGNARGWPMHTERLLIPVLLADVCILFAAIPSRWLLIGVGSAAASVAIAIGFHTSVEWPASQDPWVSDLNAREVPGRVLVATRRHHAPSAHYFSHEIPRRFGIPSAQGLFVESSQLSRRIFEITAQIEPESFVWGRSIEPSSLPWFDGDESSILRIREQLEQLGVSHLLTDRLLPVGLADAMAPVVARVAICGNAEAGFEADGAFYCFRLHRVGSGALVAPAESDRSRGSAARMQLLDPTLPGEIRFRVEAAPGESATAEVRTAWHPCWRAFAGGQEVPVRRSALGFCAVTGNGEVRLRFQRRSVDSLAAGASLAAWGALAWVALAAALSLVRARSGDSRRAPTPADRQRAASASRKSPDA
ncbi:MAG: hypothetical protein JNJ88_21505 [Planctomycetes bacterium]|nr:hypothetical protein [Planctomycetota bacterium]